MDALGAGLVPHKVAGQLLFGLQGIANDLRSAHPPRLGVYDPAIDTAPRATDHPNFEEKFDLPKDLDLSRPPEVVFAAEAAQAASEAEARTRAELSAYRSDPWHAVNAEDVELEEILITQGEEARDKRSAELQRQEWKRIEQERRQVAQARHIVEAARRNERQWSSSKLKEHYEKLWAEAAAREKADLEEIAALRAAAQAEAAARKAAENATAEQDGQTAASEAGKSRRPRSPASPPTWKPRTSKR